MPTIKLVVIGSSGVGKTSLRNQYCDGCLTSYYRINPDFMTKTLTNPVMPDGEDVKLRIWDTAGEERFSRVSSRYFRGADAILLVFDVTQPRTLAELGKWWAEFKDAQLPDSEGKGFCAVVAGNKVDLVDGDGTSGAVSEEDAKVFLHEMMSTVEASSLPAHERSATAPIPDKGPQLFWTSAKTGEGVTEIFEYIAREVVTKLGQEGPTLTHTPGGSVGETINVGLDKGDGTRAKGFNQCCG